MLFSLETLIITVSAGAVAALVVGFVTGYCCGRRCHKDSEAGALAHLGYQDAEYEYFEQRVGLARPTMLAHPGVGMPGGHMGGGPLMPTESSKLDNRQEEVCCKLILGIALNISSLPNTYTSGRYTHKQSCQISPG